MPRFAAVFAIAAALGVPALGALRGPAAHADEAVAPALPRCEPAVVGATACLDGVLCECTQMRGGSISGELSGVRWNCDALRPRCGAGYEAGMPATLPPAAFPYPYSVGIDRSEETLIIEQDQTTVQDNVNTNTNN